MKTKDGFPTVADYLGSHEKLAGLMDTVQKLSVLQTDCSDILSSCFIGCRVLKLEEGTLLVGVPNQASAARLRQKMPLLKNRLGARGWPVNAIRLKIRFPDPPPAPEAVGKKHLSPTAFASIVTLCENLEKTDSDTGLMNALHQLITTCRQQTHRPL